MNNVKIAKATKGMKQNDIYKNTFQAMELLLKSCHGIQKICGFNACDIHNAYLKEFCTIRMTTARRAGHTMAMFKLIDKYFDKAIVVIHPFMMKHHKQELNKNIKKCKTEIIELTTPHSFKNGVIEDKLRGIPYQAVFVDCPMTKETEELIYKGCTPYINNNNKHFFIFFIG